jgi:hypothetical protein
MYNYMAQKYVGVSLEAAKKSRSRVDLSESADTSGSKAIVDHHLIRVAPRRQDFGVSATQDTESQRLPTN